MAATALRIARGLAAALALAVVLTVLTSIVTVFTIPLLLRWAVPWFLDGADATVAPGHRVGLVDGHGGPLGRRCRGGIGGPVRRAGAAAGGGTAPGGRRGSSTIIGRWGRLGHRCARVSAPGVTP